MSMKTSKLVAIALLLLAALAVAGAQQVASRPGVHPISGRVYALPMSVAGAEWLDRNEREREEEPTRALAQLRIARGSVVADVGAGSGYMTERLAGIVGPTGRVYANDIQPGMLELLSARLTRRKITNVTPILGEPADPKLPADTFDTIIMVDVYHELSEPQTMLAHLKRALRPRGRLVLFEYKGEDPTVPIRPEHKMTIAQARQELEHEGFRLTDVNRSLPRQHVLVFVPER
jgi:SAM-dependent methyltransferase